MQNFRTITRLYIDICKNFSVRGYPPNEKKIETWAPEPFPDMVETNIRGGGIAVRFPDPLVNQVRWGT